VAATVCGGVEDFCCWLAFDDFPESFGDFLKDIYAKVIICGADAQYKLC
jgi:hypothetical protein